MMTGVDRSAQRADHIAAWTTGIGIGVAVFMLTWIVANRIMGMVMSVPAGPLVAMATAIFTGTAVGIRQGWRLSRRFPLR
jgi:hypothetical protein